MSDLAADQLQRSSSIGTGAQNAKTPAFNDLMDDVVMEIATYLPRSIDVLNFGLTVRSLFHVEGRMDPHVLQERRVLPCVMPSLYSSVHLPPELCSATLNMLSKRPDRTCLIRSLVVEPDEMEGLPDGVPLSALLADMASHMQALCTFIWKGRAIPLHDRLWLQLRVS